ncbi:YebC/PmpR family DNA-binding transcriptional regulator [Texcoconibacillus texcoconensis]|uniref:Probable transcriptional regulatory protein HNQ41_001385 n=1 Tax=Texcoconibacillus texcoconensis TaxID=1095777 RepID=A0A840QP87_9BACI|nr:YebC/PmpR family DNA-binding regulatory protein [Texcoconibacillus texcoconensis]
MAGHSKWSNIKRRKEAQDKKRGKIFTKISKEIFAAVRNGGDDPSTNNRLRMAINKAKASNMPNDNIERTIKKATGDAGAVQYEEVIYEGYAPHGVAVYVHALTENRNRTAAEVRHAFNKHGGNLGEDGCVSFMFQRVGLLTMELTENDSFDEEAFMLEAIDAGADDVETENEFVFIHTAPEHFEEVKQGLEGQGYQFTTAEVTMVPDTNIPVSDEQAEEIEELLDVLEDNDDVQNVYHNLQTSA